MLYICRCVCCLGLEVRGQCFGVGSLLPLLQGPKDQAQVDRLGSRSPSLLSHLTELFEGCLLCSLFGCELACPDRGVCAAVSMCSILSL